MDFPVPGADPTAVKAARELLGGLIVPRQSLGRLADLGIWAAGRQGRCPPAGFSRKRILVLAGDAAAALPAGPPTEPGTPALLTAFARATGPVSVLAPLAGASVRVIDVAVDAAGDGRSAQAGIERRRVRRGCGAIDRENALTADEAEQAVATGGRLADEEADAGTDLIVAGAVGHGLATQAAALVAALLDEEPVAVAGRGEIIGDAAWMSQVAVVRDALRRLRHVGADVGTVLSVVGGPVLAAMAGLLAQSAVRRTPVILGGPAACAAALAALRLAPGADTWWLAGSYAPDPAQEIALRSLGLTPLLDTGVHLDDGTGAVLAIGMMEASVAALSGIATRADVAHAGEWGHG
ncbi:MAG: nicotinate-nucleotide--dimethylbenzimidazole phosphoribosyltransferase [Frankiaceae bacterium]